MAVLQKWELKSERERPSSSSKLSQIENVGFLHSSWAPWAIACSLAFTEQLIDIMCIVHSAHRLTTAGGSVPNLVL